MKATTRRTVLKTIAAAAAAPAAHAQHQHGQELLQINTAYQFKVFTPAEIQWVGKFVDLIIPRTDTPGASDAGVTAFIDRRLKTNPKLEAQFRSGIAALDTEARNQFGAEFAVLEADQQVALLTAVSADPGTAPGAFFKLAKSLTVDGYYTSKAALTQELGWHGNTFVAEFKGCNHPEHQS